jgi:hypothetical protein
MAGEDGFPVIPVIRHVRHAKGFLSRRFEAFRSFAHCFSP